MANARGKVIEKKTRMQKNKKGKEMGCAKRFEAKIGEGKCNQLKGKE